jgi:hypothetical protein
MPLMMRVGSKPANGVQNAESRLHIPGHAAAARPRPVPGPENQHGTGVSTDTLLANVSVWAWPCAAQARLWNDTNHILTPVTQTMSSEGTVGTAKASNVFVDDIVGICLSFNDLVDKNKKLTDELLENVINTYGLVHDLVLIACAADAELCKTIVSTSGVAPYANRFLHEPPVTGITVKRMKSTAELFFHNTYDLREAEIYDLVSEAYEKLGWPLHPPKGLDMGGDGGGMGSAAAHHGGRKSRRGRRSASRRKRPLRPKSTSRSRSRSRNKRRHR